MNRAARVGGSAIGGVVAGALLSAVALAALLGVLLLILWLREPSASAYARTHVQQLFVSNTLRRTGTVKSCHVIGPGNSEGETIWACRVTGKDCTRTFNFAVDHEYGTTPYDDISASATDAPCLVKSD